MVAVDRCEHCINWGPTCYGDFVIRCKCGRTVYPNLGVNCPAGSAAALATSHAVTAQIIYRDKLDYEELFRARRDGWWKHTIGG